MKPGPINVDIAELVLHGFDHRAAAELDGQLRSQIARLLSQQGPPDGWAGGHEPSGTPRQVSALSVTLDPNDSPARIAERVAAAIVESGTAPGTAPGMASRVASGADTGEGPGGTR
ncbi:hypothetical protein [Haliangium sp.]|uniref:hypothetical protein n=1 Tax=Haliangium sp. TaxID=2663208 RepID=UPI003D0E0D7C